MLTNKELGEFLEKIRKQRELSLRQVDYQSDISYSHLSMIEKGVRKALPLTLKELARVYHVDYIDLLEKAGYIDLAQKEKIDSLSPSTSSEVLVYGTIPAGIPMEMIEDIIDTEEISADMLKGDKQYFGLKIKGDSMYPEYLNGDTIILQKVDDCENGQDCVIMINGNDGTFKRVFKNENGIILQPLNPNYQPQVYTNQEIKKLPVKIIGKVVELRRKK